MLYKAKQLEDTNSYELFITETATDVDGNEVSIPRSIGSYNLEELNKLKEEFQSNIDEVNNKINSINLLQ